jgi:hypothetical protein
MMNCEEFELRGLDLDRLDADPTEAAAAADHAESCARCNALLESWREVKCDLRLLRDSTRLDAAPARVEMRLKQELRTRREARIPRSTWAAVGWALAAAAVLVASIGWFRAHNFVSTPSVSRSTNFSANVSPDATASENDTTLLAADNESDQFTQLPGNIAGDSDEAAILQVRIQRGDLSRFGLPVEQDRAAEWVNVDFLVGEDGEPQAVRLHQDEQVAAIEQ